MILLYNMEGHRALPLIQHLTALEKEQLRLVTPQEYALPLGKLVLGPGFPLSPASEDSSKDPLSIDETMMVFAGMPQSKVMEYLDKLKAFGITGIALKAVLTPTNQSWSSFTLYRHLSEERNYYRRQKS